MRYLSIEFGYLDPTVITLCWNGIAQREIISKAGMPVSEIVETLRGIVEHLKQEHGELPVAVDKADPLLAQKLYEAGFNVLHLRMEIVRRMDKKAEAPIRPRGKGLTMGRYGN